VIEKTIIAAAIAAGTLAVAAGPASADHGHFVLREDRDGTTQCRYIAHGQTSKESSEPGGHEFHDNVHLGPPGADEHGTDIDKAANEGRCDTVSEPGR